MPWPIDVCDRYILYPEATKVVTCAVIGVIFILRVHAIYGRSTKVTVLTSLALVAELSIKIVSVMAILCLRESNLIRFQYAFTDGTRLHLPDGKYNRALYDRAITDHYIPGIVGCILVGTNNT
jgi:hypothetical protein